MNDNRMNHQQGTMSREQLELQLGEQLHALIGASHALHVKAAERFDPSVQPAAFHLVRWLYSYGPASAAALAEATAMDRSSISRLVKSLQQLGYVHKANSPKDGRGVLLSLTEVGHRKTMLALQEKGAAYYERIAAWDEDRLEAFIRLLRQFNGLDPSN